MNKPKLTNFLFLVLLATMPACHHQFHPTQVVIVIDPSASTRDIEGSALGLVEHSCSLPGIGKKSGMFILATGDESTAMEPVQLGSYQIPRARKVIEGKAANEKYNAKLVQQISEMLKGVSNTASVSPIYLAVLRGAQLLNAQGCFSNERAPNCHLYVATDLQETQEKAIRQALLSETDSRLPKDLFIDNTNIEIIFCGLAITHGTPGRNAAEAARLERVWKSVFKVPEPVHFQPFCPQPTKGGQK